MVVVERVNVGVQGKVLCVRLCLYMLQWLGRYMLSRFWQNNGNRYPFLRVVFLRLCLHHAIRFILSSCTAVQMHSSPHARGCAFVREFGIDAARLARVSSIVCGVLSIITATATAIILASLQ